MAAVGEQLPDEVKPVARVDNDVREVDAVDASTGPGDRPWLGKAVAPGIPVGIADAVLPERPVGALALDEVEPAPGVGRDPRRVGMAGTGHDQRLAK